MKFLTLVLVLGFMATSAFAAPVKKSVRATASTEETEKKDEADETTEAHDPASALEDASDVQEKKVCHKEISQMHCPSVHFKVRMGNDGCLHCHPLPPHHHLG